MIFRFIYCVQTLGPIFIVSGIFKFFNIVKKPDLKNLCHIQNLNIYSKLNFWFKKTRACGILRYGLGLTKQVGTLSHRFGSKIYTYRLIFSPQVEEKKLYTKFSWKNHFDTRIWSKSVKKNSGRWDERQTFETLFSLNF